MPGVVQNIALPASSTVSNTLKKNVKKQMFCLYCSFRFNHPQPHPSQSSNIKWRVTSTVSRSFTCNLMTYVLTSYDNSRLTVCWTSRDSQLIQTVNANSVILYYLYLMDAILEDSLVFFCKPVCLSLGLSTWACTTVETVKGLQHGHFLVWGYPTVHLLELNRGWGRGGGGRRRKKSHMHVVC